MSKFTGFSMPSKEEQAAKKKLWEDRLMGKTLIYERPGAPGSAPVPVPAPAPAPVETVADPEAPLDTPAPHPWLVKVDGETRVQVSLIPCRVRVIWPGRPVTRDLQPDRLNICCDGQDKVTAVGFY
ncbi:hypothetical protein H4R21_004414 [Coemansia helicoidea]|uniref:Uncharacterized protein n=1 Tax=Coemansia helicoidea TaxID=1286919 RepID=A0ACC1KY94_9FUNG|nr:hypothetical protein H4R21_004414 [Coemansia helicoidea]